MGLAITKYEDVGQICSLLGVISCHSDCIFGFSKKEVRIFSPKEEKDVEDKNSFKIIQTAIKKLGWEKFTRFFQQFSEPFYFGKKDKYSSEFVVDRNWLKVKIKHIVKFNLLKQIFVDGQRTFNVGRLPEMRDYFADFARDFSGQEKSKTKQLRKIDPRIRQQDIDRYEFDPQELFELMPDDLDEKYVVFEI